MIRPDLHPGNLVKIRGNNSIGILLRKDCDHIYLWDVLVGHVVISVHISNLTIL